MPKLPGTGPIGLIHRLKTPPAISEEYCTGWKKHLKPWHPGMQRPIIYLMIERAVQGKNRPNASKISRRKATKKK